MSLSNQGIMALNVSRIFLFLFYDNLAHNKYLLLSYLVFEGKEDIW